MEHDRVLKAILQKLADHYSYVKHLGGGEFSNVYLVNHIPSGKERALKILDYHYLLQRLKKQNLSDIKDPFNEIKRRFIAEAKLYKKIDNPNIVKIHDTGVLADPVERIEIPYFIMTYIKGASLADLIKANAPFEVNEAIKISRCVLEALEIMHQSNIIHRDIKASNIMIEGETGEAVIIDFGIAKDIVGGTKLTTTGALLGSPAYMAPEQFIDSSKVGPAMDIYAYGVVLFEMLTGDTPFKGSNFIEVMNAHRKQPVPMVSEKNPALPEGADHILAKAMAKDPKDRYKNAGDFLDSVQQIYQAKRPIKWKRILLTLAASVVVAVVGLLIFRPSPVADPVQVKIDDRRDTPNLKPKGTPAIEPREASKQIPEVITPEQLEKMKTDFLSLKALLEEKTADSEKLRRARQFMETYQAMPGNNETAVMITGIDQTVVQLQAALEEEKKFRDTIAAVNRYIKADDFKGAEDSLKKAQTFSAADPEEINRLSQTIESKKQDYEKQ
ncbi:MAG: serine/threonine protein kinase [bacterium]|nr:serine/threonine protein kinase [bacterium]